MSPHHQKIDTITDVVIGSILGINYLILFPIFIQCVHILCKNNKIQVFRSRRPVTLQFIVGITFVVFALIQPYRLFDGSIPNIRYKIPFHIPSFISNSIEYSITLALLLCYCQRAYLLHYDFNYHEAILNKEWKQFTSLHQKELDWFLKHRNTAGNRTFTLFIAILIWLLLSACFTALAFHFNIEAHWIMIQLALFALMEMIILKLILSMPGVDVFRIRDEYTYLLAVGLAFVSVIATLLILYDERNMLQVIISRLIYHFTAMLGTVAMCAISVIYPYRVHYAIQKDCNNNKEKSRSQRNIKNKSLNKSPQASPRLSPKLSPIPGKTLTEMLDMTAMSGGMSLSRQSSHNQTRVTLEELMKYLVGIEAFLDHLVKELSAENLFFLSDVGQYKNAFVSDGILDEVFGWNMALPDDIPKSHVLQEADHYMRCTLICNKYIRANSEREINISWSTRTQIVTAFDELDVITKPDPITYSTRFDFAAEEIRKLLADSFRRFCLTPQYKKFCRDYNTRTRRIQRKLSRSFRSVTRELSRDRSRSMQDQNYEEQRTPHMHAHALKRVKSTSHERKAKLSDINEHLSHFKEEDGIISPRSLSHKALEVPVALAAATPIAQDSPISYSSSGSPCNENKRVNIMSVLLAPIPIQTTAAVTPPPLTAAVTPFEQDTPHTNPDTPVDATISSTM